MATTYSVIGQRVKRVEGASKVSGAAKYTADVQLPGRLWGKILHSPVAHARIVRIDTSRARALPGVEAVLTGADLPPLQVGRRVKDQPVLAREKVRFIGERVALVAAADPGIAEQALGLIEVEYEELPAVFDPAEALKEGAPLVHDDPRSYVGTNPNLPPLPNLQAYTAWGIGDVEQGFAESDLIFEQTFTTSRNHQVYIEPHSVTVFVEPSGYVRVWAANKAPYQARGWVAAAADLPEEHISVLPVHIGGDFGGKGGHMDIEVCYFLSQHTGHPVTMVMSYVEELTAGNPRHPATMHVKTGLKKDGRLWAREVHTILDGGAYAAFKPAGPGGLGGTSKGGGPYRIPHSKIDATIAYTNTVPCGHMRSPGSPQMLWAVESHMDFLAEQMGMDPLEFRLLNTIREGDTAPNGEHWHNVLLAETLEHAKQFAGWGGPKPAPSAPGKRVGRGLSVGYYSTGAGESGTTIQVDDQGKISVLTAQPDTGTGTYTIQAQIVAETLRQPFEAVKVKPQKPGDAPVDSGSGGSRVTHIAGKATLLAAEKMRDTLVGLAAEQLGCPVERVELAAGEARGPGGKSVTFGELVQRAKGSAGPLEVTESYKADSPHEESFQVYVVDVEVDEATGQYRILQIQAVDEVGILLNPVTAEGQLQGGMMMGIGMAIMEEIKLDDDGRVTTVGLHDYKVPTMADAPPFKVDYLTEGEGSGPFGAKGVGELGIVGIAPGIANAIHDATGVRITGLPVTAEKLFWAMQEGK